MAEDVTTDPEGEYRRFPVFVDDTGRRRRWLHGVGWFFGILAAAYITLFAVSIVGSPSLLPLTVPGVGRLVPNAAAPDIRVPGHGRQRAATVVATASPRPATAPTGVTSTPSAFAKPSPQPTTPARTPAPRASAHPTGKPTAAPSAVPTTTPTTHGSPSAHPTPNGTGKPTAQPTSAHGHSRSPHPHGGPQ